MKKSIKIGFPIVCIVVVGGTLIALANLKDKVNKISESTENRISNSYNQENTYNTHGYQNLTGIDENEIYNNANEVNNVVENNVNTNSIDNNTNTNINKNTTNTNTLANNLAVTSNPSKSEESESSLDNTSDKDKAIALVEAEWGPDESVYYTNEGISSGLYIVAVRDKSNTSVKMFYKVDLENNTVEIDW